MINQYIDDVVSKGAEAVLPQNLDSKWLDLIYVAAKNFLQTAMGVEGDTIDDDVLNDENSLIMLASITEISQYQSGYSPDDPAFEIPEGKMFEYISCYALAVILECIHRESPLEMAPPTVESIFDRERLFEIEQNNPQLTEVLNRLMSG